MPEMTTALRHMYGEIDDFGRADRYIDEILEIIHHIELFEDFSEAEIRAVCRYMRCYAAPRNYIVLKEGVCGDYMLLVLTGAARVTRQFAGHDMEVIAEIVAGATLGEMSLLDGSPYPASCTATVPMDFAVLTREALDAILMHSPRLGNKLLLTLLQLISTRLRDASGYSLASIA